MSRDFTPKETYYVEQTQIKEGYGSLWDFMKNTTFTFNGKSWPLHSEEEIELRKQYPILGKLLNKFEKVYDSLSQIPGGLDVLVRCDKEIGLYVETGQGEKNSSVIKWFEGTLDEGFYYGERNEELFLEYMEEESRRTNYVSDAFDLKSNGLDELIKCASDKIHDNTSADVNFVPDKTNNNKTQNVL